MHLWQLVRLKIKQQNNKIKISEDLSLTVVEWLIYTQ